MAFFREVFLSFSAFKKSLIFSASWKCFAWECFASLSNTILIFVRSQARRIKIVLALFCPSVSINSLPFFNLKMFRIIPSQELPVVNITWNAENLQILVPNIRLSFWTQSAALSCSLLFSASYISRLISPLFSLSPEIQRSVPENFFSHPVRIVRLLSPRYKETLPKSAMWKSSICSSNQDCSLQGSCKSKQRENCLRICTFVLSPLRFHHTGREPAQ